MLLQIDWFANSEYQAVCHSVFWRFWLLNLWCNSIRFTPIWFLLWYNITNDAEAHIYIAPGENMAVFRTIKSCLLDVSCCSHKLYFIWQRAPMMRYPADKIDQWGLELTQNWQRERKILTSLNCAAHICPFENASVTIFHVHWMTNGIIDMYLAIMESRTALFC
jgi:hypothetical protein